MTWNTRTHHTVRSMTDRDGRKWFHAFSYIGAGSAFTDQSQWTSDIDEAQAWCDARNRGERPSEAGWHSYLDD